MIVVRSQCDKLDSNWSFSLYQNTTHKGVHYFTQPPILLGTVPINWRISVKLCFLLTLYIILKYCLWYLFCKIELYKVNLTYFSTTPWLFTYLETVCEPHKSSFSSLNCLDLSTISIWHDFWLLHYSGPPSSEDVDFCSKSF